MSRSHSLLAVLGLTISTLALAAPDNQDAEAAAAAAGMARTGFDTTARIRIEKDLDIEYDYDAHEARASTGSERWKIAHELAHGHLWLSLSQGKWNRELVSAWTACRSAADGLTERLFDEAYADVAASVSGGQPAAEALAALRKREAEDPLAYSRLTWRLLPEFEYPVSCGKANCRVFVARAVEDFCRRHRAEIEASAAKQSAEDEHADAETLREVFGAEVHTRGREVRRGKWRGVTRETAAYRNGERFIASYERLWTGCLQAATDHPPLQWRRAAQEAGLGTGHEANRLMCSTLAGATAQAKTRDSSTLEAAGLFGADALASYAGRALMTGGFPDDLAEAAAASKKGLAGIADRVNSYSVPAEVRR